jgi:hypothetical protein
MHRAANRRSMGRMPDVEGSLNYPLLLVEQGLCARDLDVF